MDPWTLPDDRRRALLDNIDPLRAEELLGSGKQFTADWVRHLTLLATGDEAAASRAFAETKLAEMNAAADAGATQ